MLLEVLIPDFCVFALWRKEKPCANSGEHPVLLCTSVAEPNPRRSKIYLWFLNCRCLHFFAFIVCKSRLTGLIT